MIAILFVALAVLLIIGTPIAASLGLATVLAFMSGNQNLLIVPQRMFGGLDSFPLMAVPFFILAGNLMAAGGISRRIVDFASVVAGKLTGALAIASIFAGMIFAAISGSGAASTAALGAIMIPAMIDKGYDRDFATAVPAFAGALGIIIPPSVPLILYGISSNTSVGHLFLAGIIPGIISGIALCIVAYLMSKKRGYRTEVRSDLTTNDKLMVTLSAVPALLMPVIILGGIYSGKFTPTEASVIAVVYGFIVSVFFYRELSFKKINTVLSASVITSAIVLFIIACAAVFASILTRQMIPQKMAQLFLQLSDNPLVFLLIVNVLLLIIGTFMETAAAIIILTPILVPIATQLGIDKVHFGIIMIMNLAIGLTTPPVGINLYVASNISNSKIEKVFRACIPFMGAMIISLLIVSYAPQISLIILRLVK